MAGLMTLFLHYLVKWYDGGDPIAAFTVLITGSRERTDTQIENHELWEMAQMIRHRLREFRRWTRIPRRVPTVRGEVRTSRARRPRSDRKRRAENPGCDHPAFQALLSAAALVDPHVQENEVNDKREALLDRVLDNSS